MQVKTSAGDVDVFTLGSTTTGKAYDDASVTNVSGTGSASGTFRAITMLNNTVFASLTGTNETGSITGVTIPAGVTLFGKFTAFTLTSGVVRAYHA